MDQFFTKLGESVYSQWRKVNFDLSQFPEIARKALQKSNPSKNVDLQQLIREFLIQDEQPFQSSSGFGQPELILFDTPKFYIQALFWLDGTTDIHQHEFSGAFHVMEGSSIHSTYAFEHVKPITAHFRLGDLKLRDVTLLKTGSTVPIISGKTCIHSLFHLETPSVTIVVRTHSDPGTGPQFTYLPPHVALDPVQQDALTTRRKQLLDVLEHTGADDYAKLVMEMVRELDLERGFFILQNCLGHLRNLGEWERVWTRFSRKHGAVVHPIRETLDEIIRRDALTAMRATIEDVDHRFFLALLLNLERRKDILRLIESRHQEGARATILRWASELIQVDETGVWLLDARIPWVSDLDEEEMPSLVLEVIDHLLEGEAHAERALRRTKRFQTRELTYAKECLLSSSWRVFSLS